MSRLAGMALICAGALACTSAGMFLGVMIGHGHSSQIYRPAPALGKAKPTTARRAPNVTIVSTAIRTVSQPLKTVTSTVTTPVTSTSSQTVTTVTVTQPQSTTTTTTTSQ
jgi:hypothetical protein